MGPGLSRPFSIGEALRFAWGILTAHLNPLVVFGIVGAFLALLNSALQRTGTIGGVLSLGVQVLQAMLVLALIRVALRLYDGAPLDLSISDPRTALHGFPGYLVTSFVYVLIVAVGFALLIVPGLIAAVMFGFAPFLVADDERSPIDALKESARLTKGYRWPLFGFGLALFGVNLLGLLALGVGVVFTMPLSVVAAAYVFRHLQQRRPAVTHAPELPSAKPV